MGVYVQAPLGTDVFSGKQAMFRVPERNGKPAGFMEVLARPGGGKSGVLKHLVNRLSHQLRRGEKIIVLDAGHEWSDQLLHPNPFRFVGVGARRVKFIDKNQFVISDFPYPHHWVGFGATKKGAEILSKLVLEGRRYHQDSLKKFSSMIQDLPVEDSDVPGYRHQTGVRFEKGLHQGTVDALANTFSCARSLLVDIEDATNRVEDWKEVFLDPYTTVIVITFPFSAQFLANTGNAVGRILEHLGECLWKMKGCFLVVEEAQYLCGRPKGANDVREGMLSRYVLIDSVKKWQKRGIFTIAITQNPGDLDDELSQNVTHRLIGALDPRDLEMVLGKNRYHGVKSNPYTGERIMCLVDKNDNSKRFFSPALAWCRV